MGKLNTNYGQYCYDSGTVINRAVTKYFRNCGAQTDSSDSCNECETGLRLARIVCCRGNRSDSMTVERRPSSQAVIVQNERQCWPDGGTVTQGNVGNSDEEDDFDEGHAVVELIDESRLTYRAEGNANIVLAVADSCRVLRLQKSTINAQSGKDLIVDLHRFIKYSRVVASLFSCRYVPEPKLGRLDTYDLEAFNKKLTEFRPVNRLDKEVRVRDGILYPDVAFLPIKIDPILFLQQVFEQDPKKYPFQTYCVEIKPKQGWSFGPDDGEDFARQMLFSNCDSTSTELVGPNVGKCRYCLYQYLKLQKKSIDKISKYCPLDLFSGKPIRMLNAIKGLIGAPQNNFKLSKNGRIVYGEQQEKTVFNRILKEIFQRDGRTKEERKTIFMNLMKEILLKDFSRYESLCDRRLLTIRKDRKKKDKNFIHQRTCCPINNQLLPKNCALKQILDLQLLVKSCLTKLNSDKPYRQDSTDPFGYVDELYEKHLDCLEDCCSRVGTSSEAESERRTADTAERLMNFTNFYLNEEEKYQLGATALDCSIMITFRRLADREEDRLPPAARNHIISIEAMKFLVNVTITDLDPKSIHHHKKYLKQIHDSIGAYREFMSRIKR
ncbi:inositol-pentakisphosphate 2-kinase [Sabethes cyaneus]|uniref:inositol-pentakisphosphate 2-kinase n=1 Tax=Sabethes cyaneus TaxID=53552 RepID=UPI00237EB5CD|nr:inositol-pentakisphosphate 2-kinase [Sabethes cyaneus]